MPVFPRPPPQVVKYFHGLTKCFDVGDGCEFLGFLGGTVWETGFFKNGLCFYCNNVIGVIGVIRRPNGVNSVQMGGNVAKRQAGGHHHIAYIAAVE